MSKEKTKIKRVNKNRKKSWRKHSNINEIEEFLEDQRFEERIGGSLSEKSDDKLFIIEKEGIDININKDDDFNDDREMRNDKTRDLLSHLSYFKALKPQSKVPVSSKSRIGPKNRRRMLLDDEKKFKKRWPMMKHQFSKANHELNVKKAHKLDPKLRFKVYDLWGDDIKPDDTNKTNDNDDDLNELKDIQLIMIGAKPPKVPSHRYQKTSLLLPVEVPHPGASYNPVFEDHQQLLAKAHHIEMKKIKEENHLKRVLDFYYPTKDEAPNDKSWLKEMSEGLGLSDEDADADADDGDDGGDGGDDDGDGDGDGDVKQTDDLKMKNLIVNRENRKSKAKRHRELRVKTLRETIEREKQNKRRINELFNVKKLKREINAKEKLSLEKQKRKSQRLSEKMYKPSVLSKHKYVSPDLELNLSEELTGSLRTLKVEGSVLEDRYKSLQRRNVIETRVRHNLKRKYKLKKFQKRDKK